MVQEGPISPVRNNHGIISYPPPNCTTDPRGLGSLIYDKMVENRDLVAQIDGLTGETDTYESLLKRCIRTAIAMQSRGVTSNDVITICSCNHLNSTVPYLATLFLGAKIAYLDPSLCQRDTVHLLKLVRPKMTFVGPEAISLIESALRESEIDTEVVLFGKSTTYAQFSEFLAPSTNEDAFLPVPAVDLTETAVIVFTGGTTGLPKSICLSHKSLISQDYEYSISRSQGGGTPPKEFQSHVTFSTFYWISSVCIMLISIFSKRGRVIVPRFDVHDCWRLIEKIKVNVIFLVPSQAQLLCNKGMPEGADISNLMHVVITGGPASRELVEELRELVPGVDVRNLYAITEAGGYVSSFRPHVFPEEIQLMRERPDSCGRPRPGISCKIVDNETGEILGPRLRGELRIKTDYQMNGYYGVDSSACWDADGWLKTGDVAYYDEHNCFFIVDRIKEMLKFRSWNVAPAKLEGILQSHPGVEMAVVVGLPHPEDGDHPVGIVVLSRAAVGTVTAEDLEHFVGERVDDRHRLRGGVRIVENIPLTPTGKPKRGVMKELLLKGEI